MPDNVVRWMAASWAAMTLCLVPVIFIGHAWNARAYAWLAVLLIFVVTGMGAMARAIWLWAATPEQARGVDRIDTRR
jgi:hypothetical protein